MANYDTASVSVSAAGVQPLANGIRGVGNEVVLGFNPFSVVNVTRVHSDGADVHIDISKTLGTVAAPTNDAGKVQVAGASANGQTLTVDLAAITANVTAVASDNNGDVKVTLDVPVGTTPAPTNGTSKVQVSQVSKSTNDINLDLAAITVNVTEVSTDQDSTVTVGLDIPIGTVASPTSDPGADAQLTSATKNGSDLTIVQAVESDVTVTAIRADVDQVEVEFSRDIIPPVPTPTSQPVGVQVEDATANGNVLTLDLDGSTYWRDPSKPVGDAVHSPAPGGLAASASPSNPRPASPVGSAAENAPNRAPGAVGGSATSDVVVNPTPMTPAASAFATNPVPAPVVGQGEAEAAPDQEQVIVLKDADGGLWGLLIDDEFDGTYTGTLATMPLTAGEGRDYVVITTPDGRRWSITVTTDGHIESANVS